MWTRSVGTPLLPRRLPAIPGLDIAGIYLPAGAGHEIGGDFYDVFQIGADDWVIALGDVEGKGVDAAVVTALVRYSIRAAAVEHEPSGVLAIVNAILRNDDTPRFCTAVVLRCRRARGPWRVTISCAGHPLPVRATSRGVETVGRSGSLLGVLADVEFHDVDIQLDESTLVVAYTDGVSEAQHDRELFGEERILELVGRSDDRSVGDVLDQLVEAVLRFGGSPNRDDIAAIAVRQATDRLGPTG